MVKPKQEDDLWQKVAQAEPLLRFCKFCWSYHRDTEHQCRDRWAAVGEVPGIWEDFDKLEIRIESTDSWRCCA